MRARVERDALRKAVKTVMPAVYRGPTGVPTLSCVRLEATKDRLSVTATNLELTITTEVAASVDDKGIAIVPAALFAAVLGKAPAGAVAIEETEGQLYVVAGDSEVNLRLQRTDEWPRTPTADEEPTAALTAEHVDLIRRCLPAVSTDKARPTITNLICNGGEVLCTDSHRMHIATLDGVELPEALIPVDAVAAACAAGEPLSVAIGAHHAHLVGAEATWTTVLVAEPMLPYDRLIRRTSPHFLTFGADRMADALALVAAVGAVEVGTRAVLTLDGDKVTVSRAVQDVGEASDVVPCDGDFERPIAFSPRFLADAITAVGSDTITLELEDPLKPAIIRDGPMLVVLMPVRVAS